MIRDVFIDLDDTLLDFNRAEEKAVSDAFAHFGIEPTMENVLHYADINHSCWRMFEKKIVDLDTLKEMRFYKMLNDLDADVSAHDIAMYYEDCLKENAYLLPGSIDALDALYKDYRLWLASNGTTRVQSRRVELSGIGKYFTGVLVSEDLGYIKPDREYYELTFCKIENFSRENAVMVGDSLSSDIQGGINAGIRTIWFNPKHTENNSGVVPDYEIDDISKLKNLIDSI